MEKVCEELEEAKSEIEKLREEIKTKSLISETLKRAHNEQLIKIQEANGNFEKQARVLNEKEDEINATNKKYEELKSTLKEKESLIKHLSSTNDKIRITSDERLARLENENREIVEKLEEANLKNLGQEQEFDTFKEEIIGLKSLLSALENKCLEAEKNARGVKESGKRENMFLELEEKSRKVEDKLKWKTEQFKHLEDAHKKLRGEFEASEKQWEMEKSNLLDEIYKFQEKIDSQTRISEDLQRQLNMCHQALAHEESRRKVLEIKFSETKTQFDSVLSKCDEAKMEIEKLTGQRDEEIASMRYLLEKKELEFKEMAYRFKRLEQENEELRISVKEFQETQIQESGASSSLLKLQNKFKGLKKNHKDCIKNMKLKESEWDFKFEKMDDELTDCKSKLENKDEDIKELEIKCEGLHRAHQDCLLKFKSEEAQWNSRVEKMAWDLTNKDEAIRELEMKFEALDRVRRDCSLKLKFDEDKWITQLDKMSEDFRKCKIELDGKDEEIKELEIKYEALDQVHRDCSLKLRSKEAELDLQSKNGTELAKKDEVIKEFRVKVEILDKKYRDCFKTLEVKEAGLERMAEDLAKSRFEMEGKDDVMKELQMALENINFLNIRLELQNEENSMLLVVFECVISDMKLKIIEAEEKVCFLMEQLEAKSEDLVRAQKSIQEKNENISSLKYVKNELETDLIKNRYALNQANEELSEKLCEENELEFELHVWRSNAEKLSANLEELKNLRKNLEDSLLGQIEVEESLRHEKAILLNVIEEKEKLVKCLEEKLKFSQKQSGNEKEKAFYNFRGEREILEQEWLSRELEGVIITHMNSEREIEHEREDFRRILREKDRRIGRKQEELNSLLKAWEKIATDELAKEVEIQEKTLVIAELEGDLKNLQKKFDLQKRELFGAKKEPKEFVSEIEGLKCNLRKLEREKLSEKERMLDFIGSLSERISSLSVEDMKLASFWEKIVQNFDNENDDLYDSSKENISMNSPIAKKSVEGAADGRSPLRALNSLMNF